MTLRSEAEAPFRSLRLVFYGFSVISAGVGFLVSVPQLIGALGHAPAALPLENVLQNIVIDLGAAAIFGLLFRSDWQARARQVSRLEREERLAGLTLELANGKTLSVRDLRGSARVVLMAGSPTQVAEALQKAEPYKSELMRKGVIFIPLPVYEDTPTSDPTQLPPLTPADLRWRAQPLRVNEWRAWFDEQLRFTPKASADRGLYVGLRMDGRVRTSGMGPPPWAIIAAQLPPAEGIWTGFMDGFDGRV